MTFAVTYKILPHATECTKTLNAKYAIQYFAIATRLTHLKIIIIIGLESDICTVMNKIFKVLPDPLLVA